MNSVINILSKFLNILHEDYKNALFGVVLNWFPIKLIEKIPCSYSTYLKCYYPQKGDVIMDCGAHVGNCALLFSRIVGKEGLIIAVEPFEESFNVLKERINRLGKNNILAINKGVWNKTGKYALSVFENTISCKISENINDIKTESYQYIKCTTIDNIISELGLSHVNFIKMDIEGAEIEALEGALNTIKNFGPNFAIASYHKRNSKQTFEKVEKFLFQKGYEVVTFFPPHLTTCARRVTERF